MPPDSFTLPVDPKNREWPPDQVCVVGLIGKSGLGYSSKAATANQAVERQLFELLFPEIGFLHSLRTPKAETDQECYLEGFYDAEQQIVYVQLISAHDSAQLIKLCQRTQHSLSHGEWQNAWHRREQVFYNALLFLFCMCHIILVDHPSEQFDVSYVRMFTSLAAMRKCLETDVVEVLRSHLNEDVCHVWGQTGRCALPRLLFVMHQQPSSRWMLDTKSMAGDERRSDGSSRTDTWSHHQATRHLGNEPLKRYQLFLEDQISRICRKNELTNGPDALFTISKNNFVHVVTSSSPVAGAGAASSLNPHSLLVRLEPKAAVWNAPVGPTSVPGLVGTNHMNSMQLLSSHSTAMGSTSSLASDHSLQRGSQMSLSASQAGLMKSKSSLSRRTLQKFLERHTDNVVHGTDQAIFNTEALEENDGELPTCEEWFAVAAVLYDFLLCSQEEGMRARCESLRSPMDLQHLFSESRCQMALPWAKKAYVEGLPAHYTQSLHVRQLTAALRIFNMHSRGPAVEHYRAQIRKECEAYWHDGRRACESVSLTGHPCIHLLHSLPGESGDGLCSSHSSSLSCLHACNCGGTRQQRPDPFTLKEANFLFYEALKASCCVNLDHVVFPCSAMADPSIVGQFVGAASLKASGSHLSLQGAHVLSGAATKENDPDSLHASEEMPLSNSASVSVDVELIGSVSSVENFQSVSIGESTDRSPPLSQGEVDSGDSKGASVSTESLPQRTALTVAQPEPSAELSFSEDSDGAALVAWSASADYGDEQANDGAGLLTDDEAQDDDDTVTHSCQRSLSLQDTEEVDEDVMTHSRSLPDHYPAYPSWAICRLGKASQYVIADGLPQQGFLQGSNYLLAWDVPVPAPSSGGVSLKGTAHRNAWVGASSAGRRMVAPGTLGLPRGARQTRDGMVTVRAFVGHEYECARGHRFLAAGPNKVSKINPTGHVKDSAGRVLATDMPLYMNCPGRGGKPHLAQLMRFFIVTPEDCVQLILRPQVQPAPSPCPVFHPGIPTGVTLPLDSFCCLRFPYIYADETGPILPPSNQPNPNIQSCRLLEDLLEIQPV